MSNILVTGGAGYIGSHTCKALKQQGFTPVVFDNLSTGHEAFVQWGPLVVGDIQNITELQAAFARYKPLAVIHFAASAYVGESVTDPEKYYNNNVTGSLKLLQVMREHACQQLVFSSSCASYGLPSVTPIPIDHPQNPINPYGHSKLMVEQIIADYANAYALQATVLRYFNAAGADLEGDIGERHEPETHLIPNAINAALDATQTLTIYGTDYPTQDGSCIRDYIHVADLASAHVLCLKKLQTNNDKKGFMQAYNLGSETGFSVLEVVAAIENKLSTKLTRKIADRRPGDPPQLVADSSSIKNELGWEAQYSDLPTIVDSACQWAHQELLRKKSL